MCILFMLLPLHLFAQIGYRHVAIIPFWGDDKELIGQFVNELYDAVAATDGFLPILIDMSDLPPDVPEGGFPPFVSPSPSLTGDVPFAITGQVFYNMYGQRYLRLYLWEVSGHRPLFFDEMLAPNQETVSTIMPFMVGLLFQWIPREGRAFVLGPIHPQPPPLPPPPPPPPPIQQPIIQEREILIVYQHPPIPNRWLYVGLRAGGIENLLAFPENIRPAIHFNVQFLDFQFANFPLNPMALFLGMQIECIFVDFEDFSLMVPALLRITARSGTSSFSLLGGVLFFPLLDNFLDEVGFTAGLSMGNRVGPGSIFVDMRWSNNNISDFRYSVVSVSLGYDFGFLNRRR